MKKQLQRADARSFTLDESDIQKLIENATDIRDRIVIQLLAYTGARRKEIVLLKVKNLDLEHNRIYMPTVKRRGDPQENLRQIPIISQRLKQDILTYLDLWKTKYNLKPEHRLLQQKSRTTKNGLTCVRINQIVSDVANKAGIRSPNPNRRHLNPHIFRHSFARQRDRVSQYAETPRRA